MSFILHGASPDDWDAEVFHYELRFAAPPSDEQLGRLGAAYAKWFARGASEPGGWEFADRFAYFSVAMRRDPRDSFAQVEAFLAVADRIVAIDEAIHTTANDGMPAFEPGPAYSPSARPVDPSLPAPAPSPAFAAGWKRASDAKTLAKLQKLIDGVKPKEPPLAWADPVAPTPQANYPAPLRARFEGVDGYFTGPVARPTRQVIEVRSRDGMHPAGWVSTANGRVTLPAGLLVWPPQIGLESTGRRALIPVAPQIGKGPYGPVPGKRDLQVFEADLAGDGADSPLRPIWSCASEAGELQGVAYLGEADDGAVEVAILQHSRLTVARLPAQGAAQELAQTRIGEGSRIYALFDGAILLIDTFKGLRLFAWFGGKLRALANYRHDMLFFHTERDGQVIVRHGKAPPFLQPTTELSADEQLLAITGLEEVVASEREKLSKKSSKKPRKTSNEG